MVTGFEAARPSAYTVDTIRFLKRRYPSVNFVWLMGADNLASFHRWREWEKLFGLVPIAVLDRPGYRLKARASRAAQRFAFAALDESDARGTSRHGTAGLDAPHFAALQPLVDAAPRRHGGRATSRKTRKAAKAAKKMVKKAMKAAKRREKKDAKQAKRDAKATKKSKKKA